MAKENIIWHNLVWQDVVRKLSSDALRGLDEDEVKARQKKFGRNELPREKQLSRVRIFLAQFKSPLIYILIIAGIITLALKEYADSIIIFAAVGINAIVGFLQEYKASQALRKLKKIIRRRAKVLREGNLKVIPVEDLVRGDIFILEAGDKAPADGRIIESRDLKINEMPLTGEWLAAEKSIEVLDEKTVLAERDNMVYMGTVIEHGRGKVIATATGLGTEIGGVAEMVRAAKEKATPLQKKIAHFSKIMGGLIALFCTFIFIEGMLNFSELEFIERFRQVFTTAVAVAVAAVPEGLPVAVTVILALGMQRILKRKGLVRKLLAAETLGSTSVIATDKTATLTEGRMSVSNILTGSSLLDHQQSESGYSSSEDEEHLLVLKIITLCNEAFIENHGKAMERWIIRGRPTDKALLLAGIEAGLNKNDLEKDLPKIAEIPFDTANKYQATFHRLPDNEQILYVSGAPEKVLELSKFIELKGEQKKLTSVSRGLMETGLDDLTEQGLRVVGVAYKKISQSIIQSPESTINDLVFVGFVGLKDPLRKGVKEAIKVCKEAGMKLILVTGDHRLTAKAVAKEIGLLHGRENIIEGKELEQMSEEEFAGRLKGIEVYARVEPRHKMRIVEEWQRRGEVVAMTGDGINDAPALKQADIGVALGSGTDVAKEVSDLILLPDSFNIIVAAVEEGRAIIDNIKKVITYLFSDSFTEIILIGVSFVSGLPLPIMPAQILWVNLIEDGPLGICLAFEPKEKDLMKRKPRGHSAPLLDREMKTLIFIIGLFTDLLLLGLFLWLLKYSRYEIAHIRSVIFAGLTIDSILYVFSCKSLRKNLWQFNPFSNKFLIYAWLFSVAMLLLSLYLPPLQTLLKTVPLNFFDWQLVLGLGLTHLILIEATKWLFISRHHN